MVGKKPYIGKSLNEQDLFDSIKNLIGLEYLNEEQPVAEEKIWKPLLSPEDLQTIFLELLGEIDQACRRGDVGSLRRLISGINAQNVELGKALASLVADFDYDPILALVTPILIKGEHCD